VLSWVGSEIDTNNRRTRQVNSKSKGNRKDRSKWIGLDSLKSYTVAKIYILRENCILTETTSCNYDVMSFVVIEHFARFMQLTRLDNKLPFSLCIPLCLYPSLATLRPFAFIEVSCRSKLRERVLFYILFIFVKKYKHGFFNVMI